MTAIEADGRIAAACSEQFPVGAEIVGGDDIGVAASSLVISWPVAGFQSRTLRSSPAETNCRPLGWKATAWTGPLWATRGLQKGFS